MRSREGGWGEVGGREDGRGMRVYGVGVGIMAGGLVVRQILLAGPETQDYSETETWSLYGMKPIGAEAVGSVLESRRLCILTLRAREWECASDCDCDRVAMT